MGNDYHMRCRCPSLLEDIACLILHLSWGTKDVLCAECMPISDATCKPSPGPRVKTNLGGKQQNLQHCQADHKSPNGCFVFQLRKAVNG